MWIPIHGKMVFILKWGPVPRFNIKMTSYPYRKSHCGDKTIIRWSYLHNGIPYIGKMTYLYSTSSLICFLHLLWFLLCVILCYTGQCYNRTWPVTCVNRPPPPHTDLAWICLYVCGWVCLCCLDLIVTYIHVYWSITTSKAGCVIFLHGWKSKLPF